MPHSSVREFLNIVGAVLAVVVPLAALLAFFVHAKVENAAQKLELEIHEKLDEYITRLEYEKRRLEQLQMFEMIMKRIDVILTIIDRRKKSREIPVPEAPNA